jgi:cadmium resistance protein CadD (predicted permease)
MYSAHPAAHDDRQELVRLTLRVIGVTVLVSVGLFSLIFWVVLLLGGIDDWRWFLGIIPFVLGIYLLFTTASGPERAD